MNSELAKVKAKIKALAAKTVEAGCSEHEALHAAEMVGRLLDQYNLSMDEIDIREEVCVLGEVPDGSRRRMPIERDIWQVPTSMRPDRSALFWVVLWVTSSRPEST